MAWIRFRISEWPIFWHPEGLTSHTVITSSWMGFTTPFYISAPTDSQIGCGPVGCLPLSMLVKESMWMSIYAGKTAAKPSTRWHSGSGSTGPNSKGCRIPALTMRNWPTPSRQAILSNLVLPTTMRICFT